MSIPLIRGEIGRSSVSGIRLRQTIQSDEARYTIKRFGGQRFAIWAIPMVLVGPIALFLPLQSHPTLTWVSGFAPLALVVIRAFECWRFALASISRMR